MAGITLGGVLITGGVTRRFAAIALMTCNASKGVTLPSPLTSEKRIEVEVEVEGVSPSPRRAVAIWLITNNASVGVTRPSSFTSDGNNAFWRAATFSPAAAVIWIEAAP